MEWAHLPWATLPSLPDSHRPPFLGTGLTVLGRQLQGRGAGLGRGEERVRDVRQKGTEVQQLPPGLLRWAPQQHGHHAGEELLTPLLRWLPPSLRLGRQRRQ